MEPHSEILQELHELSSPLAHMPRALAFSVPDGYFNHAAAQFVTGVLIQESEDIKPSFSRLEVSAGELPAGYFEHSASTFVAGVLAQAAEDITPSFSRVEVSAGELPVDYFQTSAAQFVAGVLAQDGEDIKPSFSHLDIPAGKVPAGYFESSVASFVTGTMSQDAEDILLNIPGVEIAAGNVPEGFFQNFPAEMLQLAKATAFVESLPQPQMTAPPANYFNELPAQVLRRIKAEQRTHDLPVGRTRKTIALPVFRWVAAAALIVGVSFGMYRAGAPEAGPQAVNRALAAIPQSELQAYVTQNIDEFETELLEKGADVSQMPIEEPHLKQGDIESYLQAEGLL